MKKVLIIFTLLIGSLVAFGQAEIDTVNIGTSANAGDGDDLRHAFIKVNKLTIDYNRLSLADILPAEMAILDGALLSTAELNFSVGTTSNVQDQLGNITSDIDDINTTINDTIEGGLVIKLLTDTSLYHAFVIGSGNATDTTLFSTNDVYGILWEGSHNLVITKVTAVNGSASKDIDIALLHDVNYKDATPTAVLSADLTVTSNTTGDDATSFNSATIASGQWLWVRIDQATTQPLQCIINIFGYLTN